MYKKNSTTRLIFFIIRLIIALFALALVLILAVPIGFYGMAMYLAPTLPNVKEIKTAKLEMPLQIYSSDDKLIGQYGNRMSLPVNYEDIPKPLIHAFLAAEDASFFEHSGISVKGLGRALTEAMSDSDDGQTGGSTITMQVAKNYFLTPERTLNRKLTELFLSRKIEEELTKDEIFTLYVNKIYLGEGAYGIKAAAKKYYSKSLDNLTIAEMAMLAGLPKAPSRYNPVANPQRALVRRNWIIGKMKEHGYINQQQYEEAINAPIGLHLYQEKLDVNMPYLAEMARYALVSRYGNQVINSGWRVRLTVNSKTQMDAEKALLKGLVAYDHRHGWRGVEAHDEPLNKFQRYGNMYPAKVIKVSSRSFEAQLPSGDIVTVPWSGMNWARKYYSADRIGGSPSNASQLVKVNDIVRLIPNNDKTSWQLTQIPKIQGGLVSLNPNTGAVEALVGGFDFNHSNFNRATQAWRQPGSTIKPLIYAAALEKGYTPDSIISDSPIQVGNWRPKNSDGRFYGDMTLRRALYLSRNLVSIRLLRSVGMADAHSLLDQFGLEDEKLPNTLSLALGTGETTPLQMATAYSAFANGGHRIQPYFIEQIYNYYNQLLFQANPAQACAECFNDELAKTNENLLKAYQKQQKKAELPSNANDNAVNLSPNDDNQEILKEPDSHTLPNANDGQNQLDATPASDRLKAPVTQYSLATQAPRILSSNVAYQMADILRDVIQRGTAVKAKALGRSDIGGKTGTTNKAKDAWFAGFHPTNSTVVWIGFDEHSTLGRREYGGVAALPVWMDFMRAKLQDTPTQWVSMSNRSKAKKQKQQIIALTDDGEVTIQEGDEADKESNTDNAKPEVKSQSKRPAKAETKQRPSEPVHNEESPQSREPHLPSQTSLKNTNQAASQSSPAVTKTNNNDTTTQTQNEKSFNSTNSKPIVTKPLNAITVDEMPPMPE